MNVVIVGEGPCYPPTAGNRVRILNLMLRLARRHSLTYICRGDGDPQKDLEARSFLGDQGIDTIVVEHPAPRKAGIMFYGRLAANLLSTVPYSVALHNSPRVRDAIRAHAARHTVDLWQFEWLAYASALRGQAGVRTLVIAHDVVSLLWQRHYDTERHPLKRWYIRQQWQKFQRFERRAYSEATCVVAVSPEDAGRIRRQFGAPTVEVVENGVDIDYFGAVRAPRQPEVILFLGTLESRPNLDAARLMLERIFPAVVAREPSVRLCIVGRNPPGWLVERVRLLDRVELHGSVADVRPFLAQSGVMAVPLRIAGGSRIRIMEALASGLPVVSTRVGAEGLSLTPGGELVVVDEMDDMAEALVECVRNPGPALEMAERGRRLVAERYDWDVLADKLERVWQKCLERAA